MAKAPTNSQQASVTTSTDPTSKRSIQMKMFATATEKAEIALAYEKGKEHGDKADPTTWQKPVGQIVGHVFEVAIREFEDKNGDPATTMYAMGDFEAVVYRTGEVMESNTADLPRYYLEALAAVLKRNNGAAILLGVEVVLSATGKNIPVAYEVRNIVPREIDSPLNRLKAAIASRGKLRLPPPNALTAPTPDDAAHPAYADDGDGEGEGEGEGAGAGDGAGEGAGNDTQAG